MEMRGRGNRGSQGNKIPGIHTTEERRSGETHSGEIEKSDNSNERNIEHLGKGYSKKTLKEERRCSTH